MRNDNGNGFALGVLCGAAVGVIAGVLFAPKAGADTRRDLARSTDGVRLRGMDMYDRAADTAASLSDSAADLVDRGSKFVKKATDIA